MQDCAGYPPASATRAWSTPTSSSRPGGDDHRRRGAGLRGHIPGAGGDGPHARRRPGAGPDPRPQRPHRLRRAAAPRTAGPGVGARGGRRPGPRRGPNPAKGFGPVKPARSSGSCGSRCLHGGLRTPRCRGLDLRRRGDLGLSRAPRVILTPGHTPGSAALHVARSDALFVGDALRTYAVTTGERGPQSRRSPPTRPRRSSRSAGATGSWRPTSCPATARHGVGESPRPSGSSGRRCG